MKERRINMSEIDFSLIENFKTLIRNAMIFTERSHDYIFDDNVDNSVAIAYLNVAASKFAAAEALYYSRLDGLERDEAEQIFHLFDVYMNELLTNVRTSHSHQWTDIEYNQLKECFDYSAFAFENK